jgi:crotonobetainyl-CoA:carnitine CoA-transferase CaiB-like acyl-CoA transferase
MSEKPLSGIVVLDLTRYLAGPYCTLLLGGLGAEVVKVESPGRGDLHRHNPPYAGAAGAAFERQEEHDIGITHLHRARNKKSVTLNLRDPDGLALFHDLCRKVDVVVENFSPGTLERMGIGYPVLRDLHPRIVLCSISGFGQTGPLKDRRAYDPVVQAMRGIASVTGFPDRPPVRCGAAVSDTVAPLFGVIGIQAALRRRDLTGEGDWVDVAMLDTSVFLMPELLDYLNGGLAPERRGNDHPAGTPLNTYPTLDGFVTIAVVSDKDWECLLTALDRRELLDDARFSDRLARRRHIEVIDKMVADWMAARTSGDAVETLQEREVPSGPVQDLYQAASSPQLAARHMFPELEHPTEGPLPGVKGFGFPIQFTGNPLHFDRPAPELGAHNAEIYQRLLDLDDRALAELNKRGVI